MDGLIRGLLATAVGYVTGNQKAPVLGIDANGGIFATVTSGGSSPVQGAFVQTVVSVDNTSTELLAVGTFSYLLIQNRGSVDLFLGFGGAALTTGLVIPAGGVYEPLSIPTNQITGILAVAGPSNVNVIVI